MSDQYYDSYDLLGRTLHAILNSFEPELTGDRLVAEYEHWTGNRLNFQYYNDRFQYWNIDDLISSFRDIIKARTASNGVTLYSARLTNDHMRKTRKAILAKVSRPIDSRLSMLKSTDKKMYLAWKDHSSWIDEHDDPVSKVGKDILKCLLHRSASFEEIQDRFAVKVFRGLNPSKEPTMVDFLRKVPGIAFCNGRLYSEVGITGDDWGRAGVVGVRGGGHRRATANRLECSLLRGTSTKNTNENSSGDVEEKKSEVAKLVDEFKRLPFDDKWLPKGAALSSEKLKEADESRAKSLGICGRTTRIGRLIPHSWHKVRIIFCASPANMMLEVLDDDQKIPDNSIFQLIPLPSFLNLNGMPVLVQMDTGKYARAVIMSHPVRDEKPFVEVNLMDSCDQHPRKTIVLVKPNELFALPLDFCRALPKRICSKLRFLGRPVGVNWDDQSCLKKFKDLVTRDPCQTLFLHEFPDGSWLVDLFVFDHDSEQWKNVMDYMEA